MRRRDIREQRRQADAQRWQQERDDDIEDAEVPDPDDEAPSRESMQ